MATARCPSASARVPSSAGRQALRPTGDPDLRWHLVGEAVERQRRDQANDALRHHPGRFGQGLLRVERGIGKLLEPSG